MPSKTLAALKRLAIVVTLPVWGTLAVVFCGVFSLFCWVYGGTVWIATGRPALLTAEDMWKKIF